MKQALRINIPGHYFLRLEDENGRVETRVVIKG